MTEIAVHLPRNIGDTEPLRLVLFNGEDESGNELLSEMPGTLGRFVADFDSIDPGVAYRAVVLRDGVPIYDGWLLTDEVDQPVTDIATETKQDAILSAIGGIDGPGPPTGPGGISVTIPVTSDGKPVDGAAVWITTDPEGTNQIAGIIHTDTFGNTNPEFTLEAGIFYVWVQKAGINFPNPQALQVLENGTYQWYTG